MIEIEDQVAEGICFINVKGEVDASSSINLDDALSNAIKLHSRIVVNLGELEYISSAGLGVFMSYIQDLEQKGAKMVLCEIKEKVFQIFQILGLDQVLNIVPTQAEAIEYVNGL